MKTFGLIAFVAVCLLFLFSLKSNNEEDQYQNSALFVLVFLILTGGIWLAFVR